jgi:hypothetical protein
VTAGTTAVARTVDVVVAYAWRDLLRAEGIPAEILGEHFNAFYKAAPGLAPLTLVVREEDAERARRLIEQAETGEFGLEDQEGSSRS